MKPAQGKQSVGHDSGAAWARAIATLGPIGRIPFAPGTWGAAVGILFAMILNTSPVTWAWPLTLMTVILIGQWGCREAVRIWGPDPKRVIVDETAGQMVAMICIQPGWSWYAGAFLLFRFFDIVKPWPIRLIDRDHRSWSVMGDDLLAGVFARCVLLVIESI